MKQRLEVAHSNIVLVVTVSVARRLVGCRLERLCASLRQIQTVDICSPLRDTAAVALARAE